MKTPQFRRVGGLLAVLFLLSFAWLLRPRVDVAPPARTAVPAPQTEAAPQARATTPGARSAPHRHELPATVRITPGPPATAPRVQVAAAGEVEGIPGEILAFNAWAARHGASPNESARRQSVAEGVRLARERRTRMSALIRTEPARALALAVSPRVRASLPPELIPELEREIAAKGDYGVLAVCDHASDGLHGGGCRIEREAIIAGERFEAAVYGSRWKRKTEPDAWLHGVALDGHIALAESKYRVRAASELAGAEPDSPGHALIHEGGVFTAATLEAIEVEIGRLETLAGEPNDAGTGLTAAAGIVFDPDNPPSSSAPPTDPYNAATGNFSHQYGPKTVLVFLVQTSDGGNYTNPPAFSTLDSQLNNSSQWYYDASYRQTWFGPKYLNPGQANEMLIPRLVITPVLQLPNTTSYYYNSFGGLQSDCRTAARALGGDWAEGGVYDYGNYDRHVVMCNQKLIGSTGLAYVGGKFAWVGSSLSGGVTLHEWGHNWGVFHANFWDPSSTGLARGPANGHSEYGDGADVMGGGGGEFNTLFKETLGFLRVDRGEIVHANLTNTANATTNGTNHGTFRIFDHVDANSKKNATLTRGVLVPVTGFASWEKRLFLGLRHEGSGGDGGTSRQNRNRNAIEIHSDNTSPNSSNNDGSHFLDSSPQSSQTEDRDDGAVKIGQTYSESATLNGNHIYGGMHLTPVARGNITDGNLTHQFIDVRIHYGWDPANAAPAATLSASNPAPAAGANTTLTANATDPNGDELAYDWRFGDGNYSITNSATQNRSWATAGFYRVDCVVSDMKGQTTNASLWVNVGNLSYRDPENPASTLAGLAYRYYEGSFNLMPAFANLFPVEEGTVPTFSIAPRNQNDNLAFVFEGYLDAPAQDVYMFRVTNDDGVRLYIGDTLVVNNGNLQSGATTKAGNIALKAGKHRVRLEYFHQSGTETLAVEWGTITTGFTPLPSSALSQTDWGSNLAPSVAITQPSEGAEFPAFSNIELQSNATDAEGVARVVYFVGGTYLGESAAAPFTYTWNGVSVGTYGIVAVAYDTTGRLAKSATRTVEVITPPPANLIGIKFVGDRGSGYAIFPNDVAGAYFQAANWNNAAVPPSAGTGNLPGLVDQTGAVTTARVAWNVPDNSNHFFTTASNATANGRLMKSGIWRESGNGSVTVSNLPFAQYDVYAYADAPESANEDIATGYYAIGSDARFLQSSITRNDTIGDYPTHDTWNGFREATALSANASLTERLGNYMVFRNVSGTAFTLSFQQKRPLNGLQIVEVPATIPQVLVRESGNNTAVTEGGAIDTYSVSLAIAPTANVTITVSPDSQLTVDPAVLTFTPSNWSQPHPVTVRAVDDAANEGPHTGSIAHALAAAGNYAGLTVASLPVAITDNDRPTVSISAWGAAAEGGNSTGSFRLTRTGIGDLSAPLTVLFALNGTASLTAPDFTLSGGSVTTNNTTLNGSVTIPAGAGMVTVTVTGVPDLEQEGPETIAATILASGSYVIGTPSNATLSITEPDPVTVPEWFTEEFGSDFDLSNRTMTLVPDGSGDRYATNVTTAATLPSAYAGHENLTNATLSSGNLDNGWWTRSLPGKLYGTTFASLHVGTNGYVTFDAGSTYAFPGLTGSSGHFGQRRISLLWTDYNLTPAVGGGQVFAGRDLTPGQERTVVTFVGARNYLYVYDVRNGSYTGGWSGENTAQLEMFDNGTLRLTWLKCDTESALVGLSDRTDAKTPNPYHESDLSRFGPATGVNPPRFNSLPARSAAIGQAYSYNATATDTDPGPSNFIYASGNVPGLTLNSTSNLTHRISGTPTTAGTYEISFYAYDVESNTRHTYRLTTTAAVSTANTPPAFTSIPSLLATQGAVYSYAVAATDPNANQTLTITAPVKPAWLTLTPGSDGSASLSGTPPAGGSFAVSLQVSDGSASATQNYTLTVIPAGGNTPPAFTSTPASTQGSATIAYTYAITTADADGHQRAISAPLKPGWLTLTDHGNGTATLSGVPPLSAAGTNHAVQLEVSDGLSATAQVFSLFVQTPPVITVLRPAAPRIYLPGTGLALGLDAVATDDGLPAPGNVSIGWSIVSGPAGAAIETAGTNATWATFAQNGTYVLRFTAADAAATSVADVQVDVGGTGHGPSGVVGEYFPNTSIAGLPSFIRTDPNIQFNGTSASWPGNGMAQQNFSVRWTGYVLPEFTEPYTFIANTDDGVRVWVEGNQVVNDWRSKGASDSPTLATANLTANVPALVVMEYQQGGGSGSARLDWESPSRPRQTIPNARWLSYVAPGNDAPTVNAGVDFDSALNLPAALSGSASDDGLPDPPAQLALLWSSKSGPGLVSFDNPGSATASANFTDPGAYTLRLSADDGQIRVADDITVGITATPGSVFVLSGTVLGAPGNAPVTVTDGYRSTVSSGGSPNTFSLPNVPAGTWHLRALLAGSSFSPAGWSNPLEISADRTGLAFETDGVATFAIEGSVTNGASPLPNATVNAGARSTTSDTRGGYHLDGLAPGTYTVTPSSGNLLFVPGTRNVTIANTTVSGQNFAVSLVDPPPTVIQNATATPNPVAGNTTTLSVLGADNSGEPTITYTWSTLGTPPAAVTFQPNGTNAARNSTATFSKAGTYNLRVSLLDLGGNTTSSDVTVTVQQTLSAIAVAPAGAGVSPGGTVNFTATATDQFGFSIPGAPAVTWNASGGGVIAANGTFTAGASPGGPFLVSASSGNWIGTANVTVNNLVTLNATADAHVRSTGSGTPDYAAQNYGGNPRILTKFDSAGYERQAYVRFDTTAVPAVASAKLRLFLPNIQSDNLSVNVSVYAAANTTWTEGTGTVAAPAATGILWSNKPVLGNKLGTISVVNNSDSWYEWDVTAYVQAEKAAGRSGICLAIANESTTATFQPYEWNAREAGSNIPQLQVIAAATNAPPTVATPASATPNPVTTDSTLLTVLGADDGGEGNLTYTWALTGTPPGNVAFSANGTNAARNSTATFTVPGDYLFTVIIRDMGNLSATSNVTVAVPDNYVLWSGGAFTPAELANATISGPSADPDRDGLNNFGEFALKLAPKTPSAIGFPFAGVMTLGSMPHLTLTYRQRKGGTGTPGIDYTAAGVRYSVSTSPDLEGESWTHTGPGGPLVEIVGTPADNGDGTETVTVRLLDPVTGPTPRAFLRLDLQPAP